MLARLQIYLLVLLGLAGLFNCSHENDAILIDLPDILYRQAGEEARIMPRIDKEIAGLVNLSWSVDPKLLPRGTDSSVLTISSPKIDECKREEYQGELKVSGNGYNQSKKFRIVIENRICSFGKEKFEKATGFTSIATTSDGDVWVGTVDKGLFQIHQVDKNGHLSQRIIAHNKENEHVADNHIVKIQAVDKDIWVGTKGSISRFGSEVIDSSKKVPFNKYDLRNFYFDSSSKIIVAYTSDKSTYYAEVKKTFDGMLGKWNQFSKKAALGRSMITKVGNDWWLDMGDRIAVYGDISESAKAEAGKYPIQVIKDNVTERMKLNNRIDAYVVGGQSNWLLVSQVGGLKGNEGGIVQAGSDINEGSQYLSKTDLGISKDDMFTGLAKTENAVWASSTAGLFRIMLQTSELSGMAVSKFKNVKGANRIPGQRFIDVVYDAKNGRIWGLTEDFGLIGISLALTEE